VIFSAKEEKMSATDVNAVIELKSTDYFVGHTPSGHTISLDTDHERNSAPTPMELLLVALGACTGVDVASILLKKRQDVLAYRIEVKGQRRDEHPRSYKRMEVQHIITGRGISEQAVRQAIQLSEEKYCSVAATLRPTVEIVSSFKIIEA
jgi:putative redox protein